MPRKLRFLPEGHLVEVTCRTIHGRHLLQPTPKVRDIVLGVLGRAQRLYPVQVHAFVFASNHYHLLLTPADAEALARFMAYVNGNIARKVGKLAGWKDKFWSRRYVSIPVSNEEKAQLARLRYILAHGCKENFVLDPRDWPGANAATALADGAMQLCGTWYNETRAYQARLRGEKQKLSRDAIVEAETLGLTPLPCWAHLTPDSYRQRIVEMLADIERETRDRHQTAGTVPAGASAAVRQDPRSCPVQLKRSPAPAFHFASRAVFEELREAYAGFVVAFRQAAERLRRGDRQARFPVGSFPPALPFVAI